MDEGECSTDDDNNYSMLQREENITERLSSLHFEQGKNSNHARDYGLTFLKVISRAGISLRLQLGATLNDLIRLLRKWCLEGPYAPNMGIFVCYSRGKEVSISNTFAAGAHHWKQLALMMKECLKQEETELRLVQMSPMYRYYGDLYPDNGRDTKEPALDGIFFADDMYKHECIEL
ncbi:hypothetical protein PICMEDRAFT_127924 [Pichia membranifaciens NRRL Y-2026]|uniref:Uncharacterized protein n=1 Tax=Pichia membranifaciens NRRL Y-2026 TaxID=763406 RepID=A0A1E3NJI9_9ASCO|nr:hypothetical protein PICMEDRAFT_127924 [Pichia membranifaciens NRRL Y-2026]ODQ46312.1 hypothetical protein PICMEDRAFT_127924 [Pichia membranifaciens NRRL Y-2026]